MGINHKGLNNPQEKTAQQLINEAMRDDARREELKALFYGVDYNALLSQVIKGDFKRR